MSRACCTKCNRPLTRCLCALITPCANRVELCIVQHPQETNNAKNSAALLLRSLARSQCLVGERFAPQQLQQALYQGNKQPLLLYPATACEQSLGLLPPAPLGELSLLPSEQLRLVVLDATWKKSRKLLYLNPLLQQLPRLPLSQTPPSEYRIRKAEGENQLSTLEASCYALEQLEPGSSYQPLLAAFRLFVDQLASRNPAYALSRPHDPNPAPPSL